MLRVKNVSNALQKRTIRAAYAQTQATPYACELHSSIGTGASFTAPGASDSSPFTRTAAAKLIKGGLIPGTVLVRVPTVGGDVVAVGTGGNPATGVKREVPFGLLANFVGGDLDELGNENKVGVWRGPDSVFELLAPAFDTSTITAAILTGASSPVPLVCGTNGVLTLPAGYTSNAIAESAADVQSGVNVVGTTGNKRTVVAHLLDVPSANRIVIDLKI